MMKWHATNLSGFNRVPVQRCSIARPDDRRDLDDLLQDPPIDYVARGGGRGYGDNAINRGGGIILMERFNRLLAFDPAEGILQCEGGCTLERIIETLLPRGFFPRVTPGTKFVTIGGCIAADVHGKNHHCDGSFASSVLDLELRTPGGETLVCSRHSNADIFWATLGGMGLTGIILSARLRLQRVPSAFMTVEYEQLPNLDAALSRFAQTDAQTHYSVVWIDCLAGGDALGRAVLMRGEHAGIDSVPPAYTSSPLAFEPPRGWTVPFQMPGFVLNPLTVKLFNRRFYRKHAAERRIVDFDTYFYPLDRVGHYDRMYGRRGFVQYQAVLPREASREGLTRILRRLSETRSASFLAVLKAMGAPSGGLLSFPLPGHTLALDLPNTGTRLRRLLDELDQIVLDHGGRVYLAKDAFLTPERFRRMYPRLEEFLRIKKQLDPDQRIRSSMAKRLGLVPE